MNITLLSRLKLVPIKIREEKKHFIVEDINSGEFYEMPRICMDAIELLNTGESLGEIERRLTTAYPEEDVDLVEFAMQLIDLQLVAEIDGTAVASKQTKKEQLGFLWISPWVGKFFFNKAALVVYMALFLVNVLLLVSHPDLFPHYKDIFISDYMVLNIITWLLLTFCSVLIHEFGHIFAMRAHNLSTKLDVGHRLILVVLETDLSTVWKLPAKERNVLYMAGLCFDMVILFIALLSQLIFANGSGIFLSIMSVIVLDTFLRMIYQCCIYMKTDLYYVFENSTGCYNLMENAQQVIKKWFPFLGTNTADEVVFEGERKTVVAYSIFYFVGVLLTLTLYTIFYIPQLVFAVKKTIPGYLEGPVSLTFWDAALFTLQMVIGFLLLLFSWRKKYLLRERM